MEKFYNLDVHGHGRNTNINHFAPIFESNNEKGNKTIPKPKKTPVVVLSEDENQDANRGERNKDDK